MHGTSEQQNSDASNSSAGVTVRQNGQRMCEEGPCLACACDVVHGTAERQNSQAVNSDTPGNRTFLLHKVELSSYTPGNRSFFLQKGVLPRPVNQDALVAGSALPPNGIGAISACASVGRSAIDVCAYTAGRASQDEVAA